ncbi:MAG: DNA cytosine methyltransferase [Candidatus Saccharibacteria bacterium]|nr:DNA cytosine methyltransferase [Candidatus Saccharibacteria bacterium]
MKIVSLFTGCGGLDLGFKQAGFDIIWANEFDKTIWDTIRINFPTVNLDTRSITDIKSSQIPSAEGLIGGPPCQSWSEAGSRRGINDNRGKLFYEYIRILKAKQPKFFIAENVAGILHKRHASALGDIITKFSDAGYQLSIKLLNASDFNVPQDRLRVFIVGYHRSLNRRFQFPKPSKYKTNMKEAIWDLRKIKPTKILNTTVINEDLQAQNHHYLDSTFSSRYMSRNRVRQWHEPSFTIQANGRHIPLHPQAPKMKLASANQRMFDEQQLKKYRRLSVRECARIQTFPDDFILQYNKINNGYKMIGNAVPVNLSQCLAQQILIDLTDSDISSRDTEESQLELFDVQMQKMVK